MPSDAGLKRRIRGVRELGSLVRSLKLLSAASMHHFERAAGGLAESVEVLEQGLSIVLAGQALPPESAHDDGLVAGVVLGSDHGMCGPYHENLAAFVRSSVPVPVPVLAVGARLAAALVETGVATDAERPGISTLSALAPAVQDLLLRLEEWRRAGLLERLVVFHQRLDSTGSPHPVRMQLLPVDTAWLQGVARRPWPGPTVPWCPQPPQEMVSTLLRQHLFLTLYRAWAEALASENAARFAAMQAAERNLEERGQELTRAEHRLRQGVVTQGLLEVVAGYQALEE